MSDESNDPGMYSLSVAGTEPYLTEILRDIRALTLERRKMAEKSGSNVVFSLRTAINVWKSRTYSLSGQSSLAVCLAEVAGGLDGESGYWEGDLREQVKHYTSMPLYVNIMSFPEVSDLVALYTRHLDNTLDIYGDDARNSSSMAFALLVMCVRLYWCRSVQAYLASSMCAQKDDCESEHLFRKER